MLSPSLARNDELAVATAPAAPECQQCGACCFSRSAVFVRVTGADWTRLGEQAAQVAQFTGHRAFMRMRDGHCAALDLRTAADGTGQFFCTVYERRPQLCRDLGRGSPQCAGEIATKAGDALRHRSRVA